MATESTLQDIRRFLDQHKHNFWFSGAKEDLDDLASQLIFINALIKKFEGKRDQDDIVREMIRRLTNVAQEAKVLFNYVMRTVDDSQKWHNNSQKWHNNWEVNWRGWNFISIDDYVAGMAQKLTKSIKNILDDFQQYGISMNVGESTTGEKSSNYTFEIANPVVRSIRDKEPSDLKFEIESFGALVNSVARMRSVDKIESSEFTSGGHSWVMVIYLNGNMRDNGTGHVSLYLRLVEKPTGGNSVNASFKFFILDKQRETYVTIHDCKERKFDAGHLEWGISQALPIADFTDTSNGLLVNESCTLGAEVYVIKNTPTLVRLSLMQEKTKRSYTWVVGYFSRLTKEAYSSIFLIEERLWKLCLYPKGNLRGKDKYLSLYLYLEDATDLTGGSKLYVDFVLSIKDQINDRNHEKSVGFWFDSDKDHEGFDDFLPLTELNNPLKGYKADGTVIIEATINEMFLVTKVS
ncbi:hypothetical protein Ancab_028301 [Ancistrocladus abbreviatus]